MQHDMQFNAYITTYINCPHKPAIGTNKYVIWLHNVLVWLSASLRQHKEDTHMEIMYLIE